MAVFETRTTRVEREVLVLPGRVNWVEVEKAISAAQQRVRARGIEESDDTVWFVAHDDEILIELPERELAVAATERETMIRATVLAELREWLDQSVRTLKGPLTVDVLLHLLERYDPNNAPYATPTVSEAVRGLIDWVSVGSSTVGGPQTADDVVRMLQGYDPFNPPFGVADAR